MHVAEFFCSLNYEILMVDMRGFGYSGGARGCSEVEELQLDVLEVVKMAD
jgi:acylglycerol lipase